MSTGTEANQVFFDIASKVLMLALLYWSDRYCIFELPLVESAEIVTETLIF